MTPLSAAAERYEALVAADPVRLVELADTILATGVVVAVTEGPETVSAPVRVRAPWAADSSTVLGHVVLTRCAVTLDGVRGDGIRTGRDLPGAVAAAVCDAECGRGGPHADEVLLLCAATRVSQTRTQDQRGRTVAATRVDPA